MTEPTHPTILRERDYTRGWRAYLACTAIPDHASKDMQQGWKDAQHAAEVSKRQIGWSKP